MEKCSILKCDSTFIATSSYEKNSLRWKMYVRTWSLMVKFSEFNWSTCLCFIFFYFTKICFLCWSIDGKFNLINIRNEKKIFLYLFVEMEEEEAPPLFIKKFVVLLVTKKKMSVFDRRIMYNNFKFFFTLLYFRIYMQFDLRFVFLYIWFACIS